MAQLFSNNARALLTSAITPLSSSLTIESAFAGSFPICSSPDYFKLVLQDAAGNKEIIKVGRRDPGSNIMEDLVRGIEGTEAQAFDPSLFPTVVALRMTAADIAQAVNHAAETTGAHTASAIAFESTDSIAATNVQDAIVEVRADMVEQLESAEAEMVSRADLVSQKHVAFVTIGTAPSFKINPAKPLTAYTKGVAYTLFPHADGSLAGSTLNVSNLGNKSLMQYDADGGKSVAMIKAGMAIDVVYDGTDFMVLNPLASGGDAPGDVKFTFSPTRPAGYRRLLVQGQCVNLNDFPTLAFLWCGSVLNNHADAAQRADFFYRCADPANPHTTRMDAGNFLKLPEPGYFMRPINITGGGVDSGRSPFKYQQDDNKSHTHRVSVQAGTNMGWNLATTDRGIWDYANNRETEASGGAEARPKNFPIYVWMCY